MDEKVIRILFALLRCAVFGDPMPEAEKASFSEEMLDSLMRLAKKHDLLHLAAAGLCQNALIGKEHPSFPKLQKAQFAAAYRCEQLEYELSRLCGVLEKARIPFIPLKGSVLRQYYPEPWMRTSCDIDVLVHGEDLDPAMDALVQNLQYTAKEKGTHDVSLFSPGGVHIELHFDLAEAGYADGALPLLQKVWDNALPVEKGAYRLKMSDPFFCFYHVTHMVQHTITGGCGIRPFLDLYILDRMEEADCAGRDELLAAGGLSRFAEVARQLSRVWFAGEMADGVTAQMESFVLHGGVYGTAENRVALSQEKKGGKAGYFFSRVFVPYDKLKRYYPILEKYPILTPVMQVRRWGMLLRPEVAGMAKAEIAANRRTDKAKAKEMNRFLRDIGL